MEYLFDGKTYTVDLGPASAAGKINGKVNEKPVDFTMTQISEHSLLLFRGDKVQKAYIASGGQQVFVHLSGQVIALEKITEDRKSFSKDAMEYGAKDHVATPMPGKVVKILVAVGDKITLKQPLVIVESMKMENELKSPSNGTVKSIHFAPGDLVGTGQPIIKIEPEE
jgi:biotin carboxyl carrier protein